MLKVGITGGIGTGKSTVARVFSILGIPVYDADSRARILMHTNADLIARIKSAFGEESYLPDGSINKDHLSKAFSNSGKLDELNRIVHPQVGKDFIEWSEKQIDVPYILKEAALLFESGSYKLLDKVITVQSPIDLRIKRITQRDPYRTLEHIKNIISKQLSEEEKIRLADFSIYNDEEHLIIKQVIWLDKKLRSMD